MEKIGSFSDYRRSDQEFTSQEPINLDQKVNNKYNLTQVANSQIQNAPKWPIFDYLSTKCIYFERAINLNNL